jgi:arabinose-5-phosphate isomerase
MRTREANPIVRQTARVREVLLAVTKARAGCATVVDAQGRLVGIFTDGDLRRHLRGNGSLIERRVGELMTRRPKTVDGDRLAEEALRILREHKIDELVVVDGRRRPIGLLDVQDLLKAGFV